MLIELSVKIREEKFDSEVTIPADPVKAVAALATLTNAVAESIGVSDEELLEILSEVMVEEEQK